MIVRGQEIRQQALAAACRVLQSQTCGLPRLFANTLMPIWILFSTDYADW
jgi:hypothetical protein